MERQERIFTFPQVFLTHTASAVGQEEHRGPLGDLFDFHDPSDRFGADTWEKAEGELHRTVMNLLLGKARLQPEEVDAVFAGDLQNQCVASAHGILSTGIPYMGLYGACSTCTEGLLCAALCMSGARELDRCVVLTTSHNCAAERQFRLPIEYGGQRTPTAQWTATAGGGILLGRSGPVRLARGMMGRLVDGGLQDPGNMGAAMAPAAADTLLRFFRAARQEPQAYDAIVTGDLGTEGSALLQELLQERGLSLGDRHRDCGVMLYDLQKQDAHAGASGCGCSASVLAACFFPALARGELRRVLFLSTGALMSASSVAQGENIFGIAPLVELVCHSAESGGKM